MSTQTEGRETADSDETCPRISQYSILSTKGDLPKKYCRKRNRPVNFMSGPFNTSRRNYQAESLNQVFEVKKNKEIEL